jgi:hypothetical protein
MLFLINVRSSSYLGTPQVIYTHRFHTIEEKKKLVWEMFELKYALLLMLPLEHCFRADEACYSATPHMQPVG